MDKITVKEILKGTNGTLLSGDESTEIAGVSTDSRQCENGQIFFPIIGENFDAHKFIPQVLERGCKTFVTDRSELSIDFDCCNVILVKDTTKALQDLACYYLNKLNLKKLAVTGSVGKTSTRDMMYYICKEKYKTGTAKGNYNNIIGLPLTIFTFDSTMEACVLEMGMDHKGQLHTLVDIVRPDIGVITNVGISHMENFEDGRDGVYAAKMELMDFFDKDNTLIINEMNDLLDKNKIKGDFEIITCGDDETVDYKISNVKDLGENGIEFDLLRKGESFTIKLGIPGAHNAGNAALAIAAGEKIGITIEEAINGLGKIELTGKRLNIKEIDGMKIVDDTYNAAPDSMVSAINTLMNIKGERHVAILGGMNELGKDSEKYHYEVGQYAIEKNVDLVIGVEEKGKDIYAGAKENAKNAETMFFDSKEELNKEINSILKKGDVVLVKGSRGIEMEKVVERIFKK